jgi:hypothetical protein
VQTNPFDEDLNLVQSLSDLVAELNILLETLQTQIDLISKWEKHETSYIDLARLPTPLTFEKAINDRRGQCKVLATTLGQAKDTQALVSFVTLLPCSS